MGHLTFDEYQRAATSYQAELMSVQQHLSNAGLGLCGEAGEVAEILDTYVRQPRALRNTDALKEELGDLLWYVAYSTHHIGRYLSEIASLNGKWEEDKANYAFKLCQEDTARLHYLQKGALDSELKDNVLALMQRTSRVADQLKKHLHQGHALHKMAIANQLNGIFYNLAFIAVGIGLDFEELATANLAKLERRYPGGVFSVERSVKRNEPLKIELCTDCGREIATFEEGRQAQALYDLAESDAGEKAYDAHCERYCWKRQGGRCRKAAT